MGNSQGAPSGEDGTGKHYELSDTTESKSTDIVRPVEAVNPDHNFKLYDGNRTEAQYILFNCANNHDHYVDSNSYKNEYKRAIKLIKKGIKKGYRDYVMHRDKNNDDILNYILHWFKDHTNDEDIFAIVQLYDNLNVCNINNYIPFDLLSQVTFKFKKSVEEIFSKTDNFDTINNQGYYPLYNVIKHADSEDFALRVLEKVKKINAINNPPDRSSYLHEALDKKYFRLARELVKRGIDVNLESSMGTAILYTQDVSFTKYLLENGIDLGIGRVLYYKLKNASRSQWKDNDWRELMLRIANDPQCDVDKGYSHPIEYAIKHKFNDLAITIARKSKFLAEPCIVESNSRGSEKFTPFEYAVKYNGRGKIRSYNATEVGTCDEGDVIYQIALHTPILTLPMSKYIIQISQSDIDKAQILLKDKIMTSELFWDIFSALNQKLHSSAFVNMIDNIDLLTLSNKFGTQGDTLLICTCREGYEDLVLRLLNYYYDISATNSTGRTAIYYVNLNKMRRVAERMAEIKKENEELYISSPSDSELI